MSTSRSLPEAVRGCWYYVPETFEIAKGLQRPYQILSFAADGSFQRYQIKSERRKATESGDYTYDGNFLIIRGRNTETFRVNRRSFWRWDLEGKKKGHCLLRGLFTEADEGELTEAQSRDIRILPLRAKVESDFEGDDVIYRLVYEGSGDERILLGSFFVEYHDDNRLWVGISPIVAGIEPPTWERIIRDSFLDMHLGKPDVGVVTTRLLDTDESRVFNYQIPR